MRVVTTAEMKQIEAQADASGLTYSEMMRRAGEAVARVVDHELAGTGLVVVLAGPGNNGGDALIAAAELDGTGLDVRVYLWKRDMDGDELVGRLARLDVEIVRAADDPRLETLHDWLEGADAVVDGLVGTGMSGQTAADLAAILDAVAETRDNVAPPVVVAVDIATGVNPDDGSVDPHSVPADLTVTFGLPKLGHYLFPGATYVGDLVHDSIGIPDDDPEGRLFVITPGQIAGKLPKRPMDGHKGLFGRALVVAGSAPYTGAAYLAATAAYRSGCGVVTLAVAGSVHPIVAGLLPEATFVLLPEDMGVIARGGADVVKKTWADCDALLVGPGLTTEKPAREFLLALLGSGAPAAATDHGPLGFHVRPGTEPAPESSEAGSIPRLVVDADALNLLAANGGGLGLLPAGSIVTPHPGEMARLTGVSTDEVNADRIGVARRAAKEWGHIVVLKGAFTVIAAPDGRTALNPFANAVLATAGSGDVLAGLVVGFLAQGMDPFDSALAGAFVHGLAGELGATDFGNRAFMAGDLLEMLPVVMGQLDD